MMLLMVEHLGDHLENLRGQNQDLIPLQAENDRVEDGTVEGDVVILSGTWFCCHNKEI